MNPKKIFVYILLFALGLTIGFIVSYHPAQSIPPTFYKTEAYFSPNGGVASNIIKAINSSKATVDLAIFDFTSQEISSALENAQKRGVKVRIIADSRQAKGSSSVIPIFIDRKLDVKIIHGEGRGIMHNKFAIFDGDIMVTGSYNWTNNAEHFNYENAIFITDPNVIKEYRKDFDKMWQVAHHP